MSKIIHLISNAHIDPTWQWEWEEGAAEAISTFRTAAELCEEFDGYVFCHNEALLYMWVEEYEPVLFQKIKKLVREKRWHIMGGWFNQPDCNMPSGEAFIRQALFGRKYFKNKFGVVPKTAINFDPFGHTRGLVQILKKSGYNSYLFCRPNNNNCPLPSDFFTWKGYDGSEITACRVSSFYNSALGNAVKKIKSVIDDTPDNAISICLWGVGNHGGGPSRQDLTDISELQKSQADNEVYILHSTPEAFFEDMLSKQKPPVYEKSLNLWAPGCYTSQIRIKQRYRYLENMLFMTEKMCTHASMNGVMDYPVDELRKASLDLLNAQFHDTLPGTSVQPVEEAALRSMDHGLEILSRIRARAFFALAAGQPKPNPDEIPILVYNPHPYQVEGDFECEFMLWDQNWKEEFSDIIVHDSKGKLPSQCEKELSNIPIDWRKRVVFHACLEPMSINNFYCKVNVLPKKPEPKVLLTDGRFVMGNERLKFEVNAETGLVERYEVDGKNLLKPGAFVLRVMDDTVDPWSMHKQSWNDEIGRFKLLNPADGSAFSGIDCEIPSVRVIEDGEVRTVVETVQGYGNSFAVVRYKVPKVGTFIDIDIRLQWSEKRKMVKLNIPTALENSICEGETAFGRESLHQGGRENVSQRYIILYNDQHAISIINDGIYGSSCIGGDLNLTLLRSPAYTAHPIGERKILPQDRFSPYIDQGERIYKFRLYGGSGTEVRANTAIDAAIFNQSPFCLSFFAPGITDKPTNGISIEGDKVEMTALKLAEDGNGYILRLFNPSEKMSRITVDVKALQAKCSLVLAPFEVSTLRISTGNITQCQMMEDII